MTAIGKLDEGVIPYKIVKAMIGAGQNKNGDTITDQAGNDMEFLVLKLERVRGDKAGESFVKNFATFRKNADDGIGGDAKSLLVEAGKILGKTVDDTDELVGKTFNFKSVETPGKNGGKPFVTFIPVSLYGANGSAGKASTPGVPQRRLVQ